ncbi:YebC/PmpR family DNA-binding transcriptional regulator [Photobacterium sp. WH77]|uniref:Probable transcriptional regulatory protein IFO68_17855 n=1 Tax=Photobacterium arenosum TaxID=2774143 RepID=A0ABR9BQP0_9GAMM|nr:MULTISPECIES: YebC/PmpR family DNA-binding transcriptional regulator [Photobacterium]MBD8514549.1 YebC/PmpR family DNA-binding transcriptional regulator [Photobacterium arenosum]MBV7264265.1 YebC/PmpR family DNA-binding transcriptional regulator [Photobacterium sp. WH24]MCG2838167.1 YebC/PmpR family DNA-binding transcriptional regulator [Photobacterium sp. WH77]MCG2845785.1 YebC/PmpR family DNA-binding transcriptional regulator [Photobacterium sp. WH80]MDO6581502.1 YebC/PmpR family DNA-bind
MGRSFEVRKASMAKTQGAKIKVYSKYGKEIYMSAKNGGTDPDSNLSLRRLMEKAKKDQVPSHVIEKAIDKASGGGGEDFSTARYEGFGPGGCSVIVDCLTDNNNRTYMDVRQCFVKNNAKIGAPGAVAHMFDHQAVFQFKGDDEEAVMEALIMGDADVTDIEAEDGMITVFAPHTEFFKVKNALSDAMPDLVMEVEEITFVPQAMHPVTGDDVATFDKFLDMLNDCDDVQNVYHNAEIEG